MKKNILIVNNEVSVDSMGDYINPIDGCWHSVPLEVLIAVSKIGDFQTRLVFHKQLLGKSVADFKPDAVIACGRYNDWLYRYSDFTKEFDAEVEFILSCNIPYMGICGGHQIIGGAHNVQLGAMGTDQNPVLEYGYIPCAIVQKDPLFNGLPDNPVFMMGHRDELKDLPIDFELLASSAACKIQAIKHRRKIMYGVQFHPEYFDETHQDGYHLLSNFLRMV